MTRFGLRGRAALVTAAGRSRAGVALAELEDAASRCALLVNTSGNLTLEPLLSLPRARAYLDLDPGYTQAWQRSGALGRLIARHEHLLTVGLCVDRPGWPIPTGGARWRAVPPPVVLADWPACAGSARRPFTTVASWRGAYGRLEHGGRLHGQKAHEFRRLADLPRHCAATFEVALAIDGADLADAELLQQGGWRLADPRAAAGDPDAFRGYVQRSAGELSAAQGVYVETRSGWFSDRTTRYLASGRPAVVQDTGWSAEIPNGEGLIAFRTPSEAAAGVAAVLADYDRHARAARALAEERFSADVVLGGLLEDLLP